MGCRLPLCLLLLAGLLLSACQPPPPIPSPATPTPAPPTPLPLAGAREKLRQLHATAHSPLENPLPKEKAPLAPPPLRLPDQPELCDALPLHDGWILATPHGLFALSAGALTSYRMSPGDLGIGQISSLASLSDASSGQRLLVAISHRSLVQRLLTLPLPLGVARPSPLEGQPGLFSALGGQVWSVLPGPGAPFQRMSPDKPPQAFARPLWIQDALITTLQPYAENLIFATADGAVLALEPATGVCHPILTGGPDGGGAVLDLAASEEGLWVSSQRAGLMLLTPGKRPASVDAHARLRFLSPSGQEVCGIEGSSLVCFHRALSARVRYVTDPLLQDTLRLRVTEAGIFVVTPSGLFRLEAEKGSLLPVVTVGRRSGTEVPSPADVDRLIRYIATQVPSSRAEAYRKLLQENQPEYEEVFLMGLNEDDPEVLEVVVDFFRTWQPERAIEPLLEVLVYVAGDGHLRERVTDILTGFGAAVIEPTMAVLTQESPERLEGGAERSLIRLLTHGLDRETPERLNHFLAEAKGGWLLRYGSAAPPPRGLPLLQPSTFEIIAQRLSRAQTDEEIEGLLRIVSRLSRRPDLPSTVEKLVPYLVRQLDGKHRRFALYALTLVSDGRAVSRCMEIARLSPQDRFWALQVLASSGDDRAFSYLAAGLEATAPDVRALAAWTLQTEISPPESLPTFKEVLLRSDPLCTSCAQVLGRSRSEGVAPLLEARLAAAPPSDQAILLASMLPVADNQLATHLRGWLSVAYLAPLRAGRQDLNTVPVRDVFLLTFILQMARGGPEGAAFVRSCQSGLPSAIMDAALEAAKLEPVLAEGVDEMLKQTIQGAGSVDGVLWPLDAASSTDKKACDVSALLKVRPHLFALVAAGGDEKARAVLEDIMLYALSPTDRWEATVVLAAMKQEASLSAFRAALQDPYFQEGPFPFFRFPVRHAASRALSAMGIKVERHADRTYHLIGSPSGK